MLGYPVNKALICGQNNLYDSAFLYALKAWLRVPAVNISTFYWTISVRKYVSK